MYIFPVLYTCIRKMSSNPSSTTGMSGLASSVYAYLLKKAGPKNTRRFPATWMIKYRRRARPVMPISSLVPTDELKTRNRDAIGRAVYNRGRIGGPQQRDEQ